MRRLFNYAGIDRTIVYLLAGRGSALLSGLVTLWLVAHLLSKAEQGFYYTFSSLLSMQVLFELGMSYVIMQFASHEMARLQWSADGTMEGDPTPLNRLAALAQSMLRWYGAVSILLLLILLPVGWAVFTDNNRDASVDWRAPWIWLVASAALNVLFLPLLAMLEGCGRVTEIARLRMLQNIAGGLATWLTLLMHGGILALPLMNSGIALITGAWLWATKSPFLKQMLKRQVESGAIRWKTEILPFQWKIAVSWVSGYFIFQLFTPVAFIYCGATEAGQIGMTIAIANAMMSIAMAWMNARAPGFGALVARRDYATLDRSFSFALSRSLAVILLLGIALCAADYLLHRMQFPLAARLLAPAPFAQIIAATICTYVTYAQSTYLRAHKEEPLMYQSMASAALTSLLTLWLGKLFGVNGIVFAYLAVSATVGLGLGSLIFSTKRRQWRGQALAQTVEGP